MNIQLIEFVSCVWNIG